jgi:hypothetical protein
MYHLDYPGLSQTQVPDSPSSPEYLGTGNPVPYKPMAGRADRLSANIVGGGESTLGAGGYPASSAPVL